MTTSREIKKALNRAFKGVKFSVTTRNILCETITIKWCGQPYINQVEETTKPWNTFENHSDTQSDYFNYTGVRIEFERLLSDEEKTVVDMILEVHGYEAQDGKKIEFTQNDYSCHFFDFSSFHDASYWHNKALKQYLYNGQFSEEVVVTEEVVDTEEVIVTDEVVATEQVELIKGDYVDGQTNGKIHYIQIHWHEGLPCIEEDAKFATFKSAHEAILRLYQNQKDCIPEGCYIKLKFSVFYTDEVYTGRLDLCPTDDNPEITDNIIKKHCTEFLDYQRKKGSVVTYDYTFDDFVEDLEDKDIQAISQEWFLHEDKDLQHLTRGVSPQQYQQVISKCFQLDAESTDNNDLLQRYTQWVQRKIQEGKSSKIVSFDDWLEYQQ